MKVAVIGLGARLAKLMADFVSVAPDFRVVAYVDPSADRVEKLTALGMSAKAYADAPSLYAAEELDMIMIGSPNHLHLGHIREALETDVQHIFVEKPVVISKAETLEIARLMAKHDGARRLMVGLVLRYAPLYRALRKAQADGQIGEIMSIEASEHIAPYHGSFFMRDWRRDSALSGGFMLEKCCHDLDLYQGVVGARPVQIASFGGRKKFLPAHRPATDPSYLTVMSPRWNGTTDAFSGEGDLVDYQTAIVSYANGATMAFHTNLNVPDEFRRFCVVGRDGMAEGDFIRNSFRVTASDSGERLTELVELGSGGNAHHYGADVAMARDILAYVRGEETSLPVSVIDALEAGVTALTMDEARREGRVVDLTGFWQDFDAALAGKAA